MSDSFAKKDREVEFHMKKHTFKLSFIPLLILLFVIALPLPVKAAAQIALGVGDTTTVSLVENKSTIVSSSWSIEGDTSAVQITSRSKNSCTIKAVKATSGTVYAIVHCKYMLSGSAAWHLFDKTVAVGSGVSDSSSSGNLINGPWVINTSDNYTKNVIELDMTKPEGVRRKFYEHGGDGYNYRPNKWEYSMSGDGYQISYAKAADDSSYYYVNFKPSRVGSYSISLSYYEYRDGEYKLLVRQSFPVHVTCSHETELRNAKSPTMEEKGYTGDKVCLICGEIVESGEEIPCLMGGSCGENAFWILDQFGTLTISGFGNMYAYSGAAEVPWYNLRNNIKEIVIKDGIKSIGEKAFSGCTSLTCVELSGQLKKIGDYAFNDCSVLKSIEIPPLTSYIGNSAFSGCITLDTITFRGDAPIIGNKAFDKVTATVNYPSASTTWNASIRADYGGSLTWEPYNGKRLSKCSITLSCAEFTYTGEKINPEVTVIYEKTLLVRGTDYEVYYSDNMQIGTGTVTIVGIGEYVGVVTQKFQILAPIIPVSGVVLSPSNLSMTVGETKKLEATIIPENADDKKVSWKSSDDTIVNIVDGTVTAVNAGTATITVTTSVGGYKADCVVTVIKSMLACEVKISPEAFIYNGEPQTPKVVVKDGTKILSSGIDYTLSYSNNINIGTGIITITGKGNYTGTKTVTFTIGAAKDSILMVKNVRYKITKVYDSGNGEVSAVGVDKSTVTSLAIPATIKISGKTFKVVSVAAGAFKGNKKLKKVSIGNNVTVIGKQAFSGCKKLSSLKLPSSLVTIGTEAFRDCIKLKKVTIPAKVKTIGKYAFCGCRNLRTVTVKSSALKKVGKNALKGIAKNASIKVPVKKFNSYRKLFKGKGIKVKSIK